MFLPLTFQQHVMLCNVDNLYCAIQATQAASRALYNHKLSCGANEILNKWVFRSFLNCSNDDSRCSESGRLFHARRAPTVKARSPIVDFRMHGTTSWEVDDDRSLCLDSRSATGWSSSDRYCGAKPLRHLNVRTHSLYVIRSSTRSQCKSFTSGVTWSYFCAPAVRRAAALTTVCNCWRSHWGRPAKTTLQ